MDELTAYILQYYRSLMTSEELESYQALILGSKDTVTATARIAKIWRGRDRELRTAQGFLGKDPNKYLDFVRDRVLREHGDKVFVNRCSKCNALARTPKAKQCLGCGHDWH